MAGSASKLPEQEEHLECLICLERFKKPKLLPCHHTFCEGCLLDLLEETERNDFIECPSCRKRQRLTKDEVPKLQTNFYLLPYLESKEREKKRQCPVHPGEGLRFLCKSCGKGGEAVCCHCVVEDHKGHELQDLVKATEEAKSELQKLEPDLDQCCNELSDLLTSVQEHKAEAEQERQSVECILQQRARDLHGLIETHLKEALAAVKEIVKPVEESEKSLETALKGARGLRDDVERVLKKGGDAMHNDVTQVMTDVMTGRGSERVVQRARLDHTHVLQCGLPALRCDLEGSHSELVSGLLGQVFVDRSKTGQLSQLFVVRVAFSCCPSTQDQGCQVSKKQVHALCPSGEGEVWVAYGASHDPVGPGWVARFSQTGQLMNKPVPLLGRVCIAGLGQGWVRVEGRHFPHVDLYGSQPQASANKRSDQYDVSNKQDARLVLSVHSDGQCELRKKMMVGCVVDSHVSYISARHPIAMDVSGDGRLVAVVEQDQSRLLLYRCGHFRPFGELRSHNGKPVRPTDVCFIAVGKEERLIVADTFNDVLLVIEVKYQSGGQVKGMQGQGPPCRTVRSASYNGSSNPFTWNGSGFVSTTPGNIFNFNSVSYAPLLSPVASCSTVGSLMPSYPPQTTAPKPPATATGSTEGRNLLTPPPSADPTTTDNDGVFVRFPTPSSASDNFAFLGSTGAAADDFDTDVIYVGTTNSSPALVASPAASTSSSPASVASPASLSSPAVDLFEPISPASDREDTFANTNTTSASTRSAYALCPTPFAASSSAAVSYTFNNNADSEFASTTTTEASFLSPLSSAPVTSENTFAFSNPESCGMFAPTTYAIPPDNFALGGMTSPTSESLRVVEEVTVPGKPTALCPDGQGRLWVGCHDGSVLTLTSLARSTF